MIDFKNLGIVNELYELGSTRIHETSKLIEFRK